MDLSTTTSNRGYSHSSRASQSCFLQIICKVISPKARISLAKSTIQLWTSRRPGGMLNATCKTTEKIAPLTLPVTRTETITKKWSTCDRSQNGTREKWGCSVRWWVMCGRWKWRNQTCKLYNKRRLFILNIVMPRWCMGVRCARKKPKVTITSRRWGKSWRWRLQGPLRQVSRWRRGGWATVIRKHKCKLQV